VDHKPTFTVGARHSHHYSSGNTLIVEYYLAINLLGVMFTSIKLDQRLGGGV